MRPGRILLALTLLLAALMIGAYLLRLPIASHVLRSAMASAGFEAPRGEVTAIGLSRVRINGLAAGRPGAEGFQIETVEADYHWRRLWAARAVDAVRIGPGFVRLALAEDGAASIGGMGGGGMRIAPLDATGSGAGGEAMDALPFSSLAVSGLKVIVDAPEGAARAALTVDYNVETGGRATLSGETGGFGRRALRMENASVDAALDFAANGEARLEAAVKGDAFSPDGVLRNIDVILTGAGGSWRALAEGDREAFAFDALLRINGLEVPVEAAPALAGMAAAPEYAVLRGEAVGMAMISGDVAFAVKDGETTIGAGPRPLSVRTDTGVVLTVTALDGAPFYARGAASEKAALAYVLESAPLSAAGSVSAATVEAGWRVDALMDLGAFRSEFLSFDAASLAVGGAVADYGVEADVSVKTGIRTAAFGDYELEEAPLDLTARVSADPEAEEATVALLQDCLQMDGLTVRAPAQNMRVTASGARLCPENRVLARARWSDGLTLLAGGDLAAERLRYRMGETVIDGAPPRIAYAASYDAGGGTSASGAFRGGRMNVNDFVIADEAEGAYEFLLKDDAVSAEVRLDRARIAQKAELEMVAPVTASGGLSLKDRQARFNYVVETPSGARLGKGGGAHDLETGRGETVFRTGRLEFAPGGLQPEALAPVLRGFVEAADGVIAAEAKFEWAGDALSSAAVISLDDITFEGPTRAVNRTRGVNGALSFSSLAPVATDGEQTVSVAGVDLDALLLERGEIVFDMPGDETIRIARAFFPWFGGTLGVFDANASMASGEALAPLRVDNIDLNQVLTYFDMDGLDGEGVLSGVLPLAVRGGRAFIENGVLQSQGAGVLRYRNAATDQAAAADRQTQIAFDLLRDLRYDSLSVEINGPLDGRLDFRLRFEGSGPVSERDQDVRLPVRYNITLDAALLELLNQANLSRNVQMQIDRALSVGDGVEDPGGESAGGGGSN